MSDKITSGHFKRQECKQEARSRQKAWVRVSRHMAAGSKPEGGKCGVTEEEAQAQNLVNSWNLGPNKKGAKKWDREDTVREWEYYINIFLSPTFLFTKIQNTLNPPDCSGLHWDFHSWLIFP